MFYNLKTFFMKNPSVFADKPWLIALATIREGMTLIALPTNIRVIANELLTTRSLRVHNKKMIYNNHFHERSSHDLSKAISKAMI